MIQPVPSGQDPQTYALIGAAMEVHRELGAGFLEAVYHESYQRELATQGIPFDSEVPLQIQYKGGVLQTRYRVDLICYGEIVVELKALRMVGPHEEAQVLNYLKASSLTRGLLLNFGTASLSFRRFIWTHEAKPESISA